jgi:hypothetical protein
VSANNYAFSKLFTDLPLMKKGRERENLFRVALEQGREGSVFAPRAAIFFDNGHIDGMVVTGSLEGGGEYGETLFHGCIPFKQAASW